MTLMRFLKVFALTVPVFLLVDAVWLGLVARRFIDRELMAFERTIRWTPAILVYLLLVAGTILFAVPRADGSVMRALLWGAAFGVATYGTYDLTNYATLKGWTLTMTVVDISWGAFIQGFTAVVATIINNRLP